MMRLSFLFLLLFWSSQLISSSSLRDELIDLQKYVPMDRLNVLFAEYLIYDQEFRQTIGYIRSEQFAEAWNKFLEIRKVQQLLSYMADAGLPVNEVLELFATFTGMARPRMLLKRSNIIRTGGLTAFIADVINVVSESDVEKIHKQKLKSSPQYREMTEKMLAPEFKRLFEEVFSDPEVKILQVEAEVHGIHFIKLVDLLKSFFGWSSVF